MRRGAEKGILGARLRGNDRDGQGMLCEMSIFKTWGESSRLGRLGGIDVSVRLINLGEEADPQMREAVTSSAVPMSGFENSEPITVCWAPECREMA